VSSPAGWYPDPGGQRGAFRYWNGSTWSAQLSSSQTAAPPSAGLGQPSSGAPQFGQYGYQPGMGYAPQPQKKRNVGLWIGIVVGVLVIALIGYGVFRLASQGGLTNNGGTAGGNSTAKVCPVNLQSLAPVNHTKDGRVHGGLLSFPALGAPWEAPIPDTRVPFGRDVMVQNAMVEPSYNGAESWVASVLVAELAAGDGFFSPQEGSEIVVKCLIGAFYANAEVTRDDKVSKATTVGGKDAWLVETHLTFDIPKLKTKGETAIVLIVATSTDASSLFYASIPDTSPQFMQPARDSMTALTVGN
jgi:hypothetical protein